MVRLRAPAQCVAVAVFYMSHCEMRFIPTALRWRREYRLAAAAQCFDQRLRGPLAGVFEQQSTMHCAISAVRPRALGREHHC